MLNYLLIALLSYLLGSIPSGTIVGLLARGIDVRERGSGSSGTTNVIRVLGMKPGIIVAALDLGKGYAAVALVGKLWLFPGPSSSWQTLFILPTLAAMLGHVKPVFAGFRGGRGIATAAGAITAGYPLIAPFCLALFLLMTVLTGFVALASFAAAAALPLVYYVGSRLSGRTPDPVILGFFILLVLVAAFLLRRRLGDYVAGRAELFEKVMLFRSRRGGERRN